MRSTRSLRVVSRLCLSTAMLAVLSLAVDAADRSGGGPLTLELPAGPARARAGWTRWAPASRRRPRGR